MDIGFPKEIKHGAHTRVIGTGVIRGNDVNIDVWMVENFSYTFFYIFNYFLMQ